MYPQECFHITAVITLSISILLTTIPTLSISKDESLRGQFYYLTLPSSLCQHKLQQAWPDAANVLDRERCRRPCLLCQAEISRAFIAPEIC